MRPLIDLGRVRSLLCVGAHSDDIEIGCGATVARLARENPGLRVTWVVFCGDGERADEARAAAGDLLEVEHFDPSNGVPHPTKPRREPRIGIESGTRSAAAAAASGEHAARSGTTVHTLGFRDAHLPAVWTDAKAALATFAGEYDLILTHRRDDRHQDHRLLAELTDQVFRDHAKLAYEIPKTDADLGRPNVYVPADTIDFDRKLRALRRFRSQHGKAWFDDDTFRALARIRGLECNAPSRLAEAFYTDKLIA